MLENGIELWRTGMKDIPDSLRAFLEMAGEENICSVLVEGGRRLVSWFLESRLANRLYLIYGNKLIGNGMTGTAFSAGLPVASPIILENMELHRCGNDIMISGIPRWR